MTRVAAIPAAVPLGRPALAAATLVQLPSYVSSSGFADTKDYSLGLLK